MTDEKKQYTVEFPAGEAERIEQDAAHQGVSATDFVIYCARSVLFGMNYASRMLPKSGQVGTPED